MRVAILLFALGVWWVQWWAGLPSPVMLRGGIGALFVVALALTVCARRLPVGVRRALVCALALGVGVAWAVWRAELRLAEALPMAWEGRDIAVTGVVAELPQRLDDGTRFVFAVERANAVTKEEGTEGTKGGEAVAVPRHIQLGWYRGKESDRDLAEPAPVPVPMPEVRPGERWRFVVRLKQPHGFVNPQGFDYEAWLLQRGIRATGYVRAGSAQRLEEQAGGAMTWVHALRGRIRDRFLAALPDAPYAGMLVALAVGDQNAIRAGQWEVFRRTGITHLVAISGMHLSFVATLAGLFTAWVWRRLPRLALRVPARKAAAVGALFVGVGYALLAGMGIPVARAAIMLGVVACALLLGRELAPSRILALALLGVLLADPWAVLAPGFWLSFGAVAVILLVLSGRFGLRPSAWAKLWREAVVLQLAITLAMAPALLVLFQSFSVVSPLANAFAIPLVNFVITPLVLAAAVFPADTLLSLAHGVTVWMMHGVEWLAALELALWRQAAPPPLLAALGVGAAGVMLLPRGAPGKLAAVAVLACLLVWRPARPAEGEFALTVLDVGNGLAVHVRTATHDLLYDTGPAYSATADAGERAVLPYLTGAGVARLDMLMLSHDDEDHTGGARSVLGGLPVDRLLASDGDSVTADSPVPPEPCALGQAWTWDGVVFEVLHPLDLETVAKRDNDASCVLRVAATGGAALLVGDIGARAEAALVGRKGDALASEIVVVAHHGSRSSSTPAFVDATMAQVALFAVGYRNAHGHPHPAVWARWSEVGARNWRTDSQGALYATVTAAGVEIEAERQRVPRYWHGR